MKQPVPTHLEQIINACGEPLKSAALFTSDTLLLSRAIVRDRFGDEEGKEDPSMVLEVAKLMMRRMEHLEAEARLDRQEERELERDNEIYSLPRKKP